MSHTCSSGDSFHSCDVMLGDSTCRWAVDSMEEDSRLDMDTQYRVEVSVDTIHTSLTTGWLTVDPLNIGE